MKADEARQDTGFPGGERLRVYPAALSTQPCWPENVKDLLGMEQRDEVRLIAALRLDGRRFDRLLLRLHYWRHRPLSDADRRRVLRFLAFAYDITRDVRYYNEYLWFRTDPTEDEFGRLNESNFARNLTDGVHHWSDLTRPSPAVDDSLENTGQTVGPIRAVALLGGLPHTFGNTRQQFAARGLNTAFCYFCQPAKGLRKVLRQFGPLVSLRCRLKGFSGPDLIIKGDPADHGQLEPLRRLGFDLAVHQVGGIIRTPLISCFRVGIINDHLGPLPQVRGRSSTEFALLLGLALSATTHLVDEGIDTGPIINVFTYPIASHSPTSLGALSRDLLSRRSERFVATIDRLRQGQPLRPNPAAGGRQFFTMHPRLRQYVEHTVLAYRRQSGTESRKCA